MHPNGKQVARAGKVRHVGMSDVPAWYAARAQTLAEAHRYEPLALLQLEYSLVSAEPFSYPVQTATTSCVHPSNEPRHVITPP